MGAVLIGVLGELEVRAGASAVPVPRGKQQLLLAALALRSGRFVSTDELIDLVWGETPPPSARTTLRGYVKRLRTRLANAGVAGHELIEALPGGYRLTAETDLERFRARWRSLGDAAATSGESGDLASLGEALALWRGRPLAGLERMEWIEQAVAGLDEERLQAVERRADLLLAAGEAAVAAMELNAVLGRQPFRESSWLRLLLALHQQGRTADALLRYDEVRRLLADQLGVGPSASLRALHERLLREDRAEEPPAAPVEQPRHGTTTSALVGREHELARLDALVSECVVAGGGVVVVDGPAGVGKTALVRQWAATAAERFPGGSVRVDLHGFDSVSDVSGPTSAADALGELTRAVRACRASVASCDEPGSGGPPESTAAAGAQFRGLTADRPTLVLLDGARDAEQVRPLLPGPGSVAVVTSQNQLRGLVAREGARRLTLAPLGVREGSRVLAALAGEAVRGDGDGDPAAGFELVELCGGLPLALRIAVERLTRVPGMTVAALAGELRSEEGRLDVLDTGDGDGTSVRAALGVAHGVLAPADSALLSGLAVCGKTDFDLDEAARITGDDPAAARVSLDRLTALNLVRQRGVRGFRLDDLHRLVAAERADVVERPV